MKSCILNEEQLEILKKARDTYGFDKQVIVSAEECCELSQALLKSLRFEDEDKRKLISNKQITTELADVIIVLHHVIELFDISEEDLRESIEFKIDRLKAWLSGSDMIEYTTELRFVEDIKKKIAEESKE